MSRFITEEAMNKDEQSEGYSSERVGLKDYDDEPYGDDNVLVRASKRRAFLLSSSEL